MVETARAYKKRIDEKWDRNEENKDKLLEKIENYELLDKRYKTVTKKQILESFSRNRKAEKESEQYVAIVSELGTIDTKYEELKGLNEDLKQKILEKEGVSKQLENCTLDGKDETTLDMQYRQMEILKEKYDGLQQEVEEIQKEINDRKLEIKEIESTYGEKQTVKKSRIETPKAEDKESAASSEEKVDKSTTLKARHEQTIKDLWKKDQTRGEIMRLLDEGTGIDDELKESIKKEVSEKFIAYYDVKQGDMKTQMGRFMKNQVKNKKTLEELKAMPEGAEKEAKLKEMDEQELIYGEQPGRMRVLLKLIKERLGDLESLEIKQYGMIGGKLCFKVKTDTGVNFVYWGDEYTTAGEIGEIQNIGDKPCFKVKDKNGNWGVCWGTDRIIDYSYKEIGEIQEIDGKPCFKAKDRYGDYCVYRGNSICSNLYSVKGEIQNIGDKPCFKLYIKDRGYKVIRGTEDIGYTYKEIGEIQEIDGKPVFKAKDSSGDYCVYRGRSKGRGYYKEIGEIKNVGGRCVCEGKDMTGERRIIKRN